MRKRIVSSFMRKPAFYRYLYFILSSLNLWRFSTWLRAGEPNPFADHCWDAVRLSRSEIMSLFRSRLN